jgi:hypothetical protein
MKESVRGSHVLCVNERECAGSAWVVCEMKESVKRLHAMCVLLKVSVRILDELCVK